MIKLNTILSLKNTLFDAHCESKKRVFELISELASHSIIDMNERDIFECLNQRERLGSTFMGHGVAIPHARVKNSNLDHPIGILIRLDKAIPYGDRDDERVDIVFALLVPEEATEQHLQVLAQIATLFGNEALRKEIRSANSNPSLYKIATSQS